MEKRKTPRYVYRIYRDYDPSGPEIDELRTMADEAVAKTLAPEIEVIDTQINERDMEWFDRGVEIEQLLRRQGMDSSTGDEIDPADLEAFRASECSRANR